MRRHLSDIVQRILTGFAAGGTYDCIALMAYYTVCKEVTSLAEIEEMESALF